MRNFRKYMAGSIFAITLAMSGVSFADDQETQKIVATVGAAGLVDHASGSPTAGGGEIEGSLWVREADDGIDFYFDGALGTDSSLVGNKIGGMGKGHLGLNWRLGKSDFTLGFNGGTTASQIVADLNLLGISAGYRSKTNRTLLILDPFSVEYDRQNGTGGTSTGARLVTAQDFGKILTLQAALGAAMIYGMGESPTSQTVPLPNGSSTQVQTGTGLGQIGLGNHFSGSLAAIFHVGEHAYVKAEGVAEDLNAHAMLAPPRT